MFTGGTVIRIRFRPWGLWSLGKKMLAGVLVLAIIIGVSAYFAKLTRESIFTAVAAAVAVGALFVASYSAYSATVRAKKKDTLEAWNSWSDDYRAARRELTRDLGMGEISDEQAKALVVGDTELKNKQGTTLSEEKRKLLDDHVCDMLNGLERLAVGVELGIYDEAVLRLMGGTIIARTYERFEPYIDATRQANSTRKRQSRAYTELTVLYHLIEEPRRIASWRSSQKTVDTARLKALRRQ